ncbi:hypothetical protein [Haloterrigena salifodinae]|uniref:hypothetical protein n=1 Tax=Haloterrigena salifodinae TaxID=2675099 RepID=UPI000F8787BE|nr:hypothetical protein [Haloterrigena salifodinae]
MSDENVKSTSDTDRGGEWGRDLMIAMASVQTHHSKAAEKISEGDIRGAEYHLYEAFSDLGDYLIESDEWTIESATGRDHE